MKIIVGLGNPGKEYENTRHNVGFLVLDKLRTESTKHQAPNDKEYQNSNFQMNNKFHAEVCQIGDVLLIKPQTFMNESGKSVAAVMSFYKVDMDDLYVIHDDLDIVMGQYKIQRAKGPKIHNGVNDIEARLGNKDFWRVRIGVENRHLKAANIKSQITNKFRSIISPNYKQEKIPGRQYVLMKLKEDEKKFLDDVSGDIVKDMFSVLGL